MGEIEGKQAESVEELYTLGQMQAHYEKIDNLCLTAHPDGKLMFVSSQIIKQLLHRIDCLIIEVAFAKSYVAENNT